MKVVVLTPATCVRSASNWDTVVANRIALLYIVVVQTDLFIPIIFFTIVSLWVDAYYNSCPITMLEVLSSIEPHQLILKSSSA